MRPIRLLSATLGACALCSTAVARAREPPGSDGEGGAATDEAPATDADEAPATDAHDGDEAALPADASDEWTDFELDGAHGFAGVAIGPSLQGDWTYGKTPLWDAGLLFALRGGALFDQVELAVELAPVSQWWKFGEKSILSFNVTIGGQIELAPHVFWPLRFGLGATAVNWPTMMQGRVDLVGVIYQYGHVEFELDLLSVRHSSDFQHLGLWTVPFTFATSYVF